MARHFQHEALATRIYHLLESRMEAILRSQDQAFEMQQREQEEARREAKRAARNTLAAAPVEQDEAQQPPPQLTTAPPAASPPVKYSSLAQVKKGIKRSRMAAETARISEASGSVPAPPAKKTARKAPVNPFKKKVVASPQKPRRAQDVLNKLAESPSPKPVLGRQSSTVQDIIKKGKDKKLF